LKQATLQKQNFNFVFLYWADERTTRVFYSYILWNEMEVIELLILQGNTSLSATFNGMNTTISRRKQDTFELAMQNTLPACDSAQYIIPNFLDVALHYNEESPQTLLTLHMHLQQLCIFN
jgi:hypothetical protein